LKIIKTQDNASSKVYQFTFDAATYYSGLNTKCIGSLENIQCWQSSNEDAILQKKQGPVTDSLGWQQE